MAVPPIITATAPATHIRVPSTSPVRINTMATRAKMNRTIRSMFPTLFFMVIPIAFSVLTCGRKVFSLTAFFRDIYHKSRTFGALRTKIALRP